MQCTGGSQGRIACFLPPATFLLTLPPLVSQPVIRRFTDNPPLSPPFLLLSRPLIPLITENIALNYPSSSLTSPSNPNVHAAILDWGEPSIPSDIPNPPDFVIMADCVYFEPSFPLLGEYVRPGVEMNGEGMWVGKGGREELTSLRSQYIPSIS